MKKENKKQSIKIPGGEIKAKTKNSLQPKLNGWFTLIQNAPTAIAISRDMKFIYANPTFTKMFGYSEPAELIDKPLANTVSEKNRKEFTARAKNREIGIQAENEYEAIGLKKDGTEFFVHAAVTRVDLEDGPATLGFFTDITDRKKAEDSLKKSEQHIHFINNNLINSMIYQVHIDMYNNRKFTYVSASVKSLHGLDPQQVLEDFSLLYNRIHDEDRERLISAEEVSIKNLSRFDTEVRMVNPNGNVRWSHLISSPKKMNDGSITFSGIEIDITDRMKAEESLRINENKLRAIVEGTPYLFFYTQNTKAETTYASPTVEKITGYSSAEWIKRKDWFITNSEINKLAKERTYAHLRGEFTDGSILVEIQHANGSILTLEVFENPVFENGKVVGLQGVAHDITDRKKIEKTLLESEQRYKFVTENIADVVWILDVNSMKFDFMSPSVTKLRGFTVDEIMAQSIDKVVTPDSLQKIQEILPNSIQEYLSGKTGIFYTTEIDQPHKNGHIITTEVRTTIFGDLENGLKVLGVTRDITERKHSEKALKESEDKFRKVFENVQDVFFITDKNGILTDISPSIERHTEYPANEILGEHVYKHYRKREDVLRFLNNIRKTGEVNEFETEMVTKTGKIVTVSMNAHYRYDNDGKIIGMEGSLRDITEKKQTEKLLHDQTKLLTNIMNILPIGLWIIDKEGKIIYGNPAGQKIWAGAKYVGVDQYGEYKGWWLDSGKLIKPEEWAAARAISKKETSLNEEIEIDCFDGIHKIILNSAIPIIHSDGHVDAAIIVNEDITERKKMELSIRESEEKLRTILDALPAATYTTDAEGKITFFNKAAIEFAGQIPQIGSDECCISWKLYWPDGTPLPHDQDPMAITLKEGKPLRGYEAIAERPDGTRVNFIPYPTPLFNKDGKMIGAVNMLIDITERKRAEAALVQSEHLRRSILESAGDGIHGLDINGNIIFENPAALKMFGWNGPAMVGLHGHSTVHHHRPDGSEYPQEDCPIYRTLIDGIARRGDKEYFIRKDGSSFPIEFTSSPIKDELGKIVGAVVSFRDISERKLLEQALVESEAKYRQLFEANPHPMWVYDMETLKFLAVNDAAIQHYGYSHDEFLKMTIKEIRPSEDIPKLLESVREVEGVEYAGIWRHLKKDGMLIDVEIISHNMKFEGKDADLVLAMDVTEKLKAQEEVLKLSRAVEQSPASIIITDPEGMIEYVNPKYEELSGYSLKEIKGMKSNILKSGYTSTEEYKILWQTIKSGNQWKGEFLNKKKNGELFWEATTISPIRGSDGVIKYFIGVKQDITERKKMIQELIEAKDKAEKSDQLKSEFLAQVSHEIRTPLNAVLSFSKLIQDDLEDQNLLNETISESVAGIHVAGRRIIRTIDLILNASELQTGLFQPRLIKVKIYKDVLVPVEQEFKSIAVLKELDFSMTCNTDDVEILGDEYSIIQIFSNLVDNAIKYTRTGFVRVDTHLDRNQKLVVTVADSGIGMSKEYMNDLYRPFSQEEQGYSRKFDGNGLGLTLVKRYCELNNIELNVQSEKGKGTVFTLRFMNTQMPS